MTTKQFASRFRVSFTDSAGKLRRVRGIPSFYALGLVRSNLARKTAEAEVLLYRGYSLEVDKRAQRFSLLCALESPMELCRELIRLGLSWEANHLRGKVASSSFHRMSLAPFSDVSDVQDRHLLLSGDIC